MTREDWLTVAAAFCGSFVVLVLALAVLLYSVRAWRRTSELLELERDR